MKDQLRETKTHGTSLFPFELYKHTAQNGRFFISCHWHDEVEIHYITSGTIEFMLGENVYELKKDDIVFINTRQLHQTRALSDDAKYYSYVFPLNLLSFQMADITQLQVLNPLLNGKLGFPSLLRKDEDGYSYIAEKLLEITSLDQGKPDYYELQIKIDLLEIIAFFSMHNKFIPYTASHKEDICKKILDYIKMHYSEKIIIADISSYVGLSPNYFSAFFSDRFKQNFCEFLIQFRVEQACVLLLSTNMSVTEISLSVGFDNPSYFIRKFRERTGVTPAKYRKNLTPPGY